MTPKVLNKTPFYAEAEWTTAEDGLSVEMVESRAVFANRLQYSCCGAFALEACLASSVLPQFPRMRGAVCLMEHVLPLIRPGGRTGQRPGGVEKGISATLLNRAKTVLSRQVQ